MPPAETMPDDEPLRGWGYGLTFAGGALVATATVVGVLFWWLLHAGLDLQTAPIQHVIDAITRHMMAPLLVLVWGLAAGAIVLGAAWNLAPGRSPRPIRWALVAIAGAVLSFPVTGGFGVGGLLAIVGAGLVMADAAR